MIIVNEKIYSFYKFNLSQTTNKKKTANETDAFYIDDNGSLDLLQLDDYGPKKEKHLIYFSSN